MRETKGITILATPKPFHGHIGIIQRNAIISWTKLLPRPEIILFGHEEGTAECAGELGLVHVPDVDSNQYGTPLLADIFAKSERQSTHNLFAYINADIILPSEFTFGVEKVEQTFSKFLAVGRRTNLEIVEPLEFNEGWEQSLKERIQRAGRLESHTGIDLFVFRRGTYEQVPPLAIGRVWFDQWCIKYVREKKLPVVDLTDFVPIVHQVHEYSHVAGGKQWVYGGPEADENLRYYGERPHTYTILSANYSMTRAGDIQRVFFRKEIFTMKTFLWEMFIHKTYSVRKRLGLSREPRV